jgi:cysteine desulfurase
VQRVYLDHNATTPLDPRVLEAMLPALQGVFGNASSIHWFGQQARAALDEARARVAALIGATPQEVVFTGSGTEADNAALRGALGESRGGRRKIVCSAVEHHAVLHTARALAGEGCALETLHVGRDGVVDLEDARARIDDQTALVAVMLANNETGVIQPVAEIARLARERGALLHCDAVQAAGRLPLDVQALGADTLALSAHKLYGPKGTGALYVRRGTRLAPLLRGGSQERGRRAGTENVAGLVGFGCAAQIAREERPAEMERVGRLRDALEARLLAIDGAAVNGSGPRVANTTNVSFAGVEAEGLLMALDLAGVAVSTGAACAAGAVSPSHVLRAMGLPPERVEASLRLSLGRFTSEDDVARAASAIAEAVARQRARRRVGG